MLPDILDHDLDVVFCGTAVGNTSAEQEAYYAHPGNKFWDILSQTGLTPEELNPKQYEDVPSYGIGLTDLVKNESGNDSDLDESRFDVERFTATIEEYSPDVVAFNGKKAAKEVYRTDDIDYGLQEEQVGGSEVFVLPSTSGAARKYWDRSHWEELASFLD